MNKVWDKTKICEVDMPKEMEDFLNDIKSVCKKYGLSMERTYEDIRKDLSDAEEELKPISKEYHKLLEEISSLKNELEEYEVNNGWFYPMSDLNKYIDKEISSIKLVERKDDGTLKVEEIINDEMFSVNKNGRLHFSSYESGVMDYDEDLEKYVEYCHFFRTVHDYVGFLEIEFEDED